MEDVWTHDERASRDTGQMLRRSFQVNECNTFPELENHLSGSETMYKRDTVMEEGQ